MRVQHLARGDRGAVAVFVGLTGLFLTGMLAFSVDLGNAYSVKRRLSTAADGAALAAAQELAVLGARCGGLVTGSQRDQARAVADDYSSTRNAPGSALGAGTTGFQLDCPSGSDGGLVTVRNSQTVQYAFGNIFGIGSNTPAGVATAQYGPARTVTGLRPYGLCGLDPLVGALIASGTAFPVDDAASFALRPTVRIRIDKVTASLPGPPAGGGGGGGYISSCGTAAGNWAVLDLDKASNATPDIRTWTEDGYQKELDLAGDKIDGDPGTPSGGALEGAMNSIVGETITLPIYTSVTATGATAKFHISGFVSAQLCDWKFGNKDASPTDPTCVSGLPRGGGASAPDYLELRFRQSFTVGEFSNCGLTCPVTGVTAVRLVPTP